MPPLPIRATGARPDRDRDRLRPARLLAGAGASRARHGGHRRPRRDGAPSDERLVLPIVLPRQPCADAGAEAAAAAALDLPWPARSSSGERHRGLSAVDTTGIQVLQIGGWPAPFGITWSPTCSRRCWWSPSGWSASRYGLGLCRSRSPARSVRLPRPVLQILLMGVAGAFLTGDLFNLYVWFEVMLVASFVLMALHRTRAQIEGASSTSPST